MDSVTANTIAIIAKRLPAEERNLQVSDRLDDLGIDSFTAIEMIFDLDDIQIRYNSNDVRPRFPDRGRCGRRHQEAGGRKLIVQRSHNPQQSAAR
jgi:hypothetical protein